MYSQIYTNEEKYKCIRTALAAYIQMSVVLLWPSQAHGPAQLARTGNLLKILVFEKYENKKIAQLVQTGNLLKILK